MYTIMAGGAFWLTLLAVVCCSFSSAGTIVKPTKALLQWNAYEMGAMISWNIDTMDGIQGCQPGMEAVPLPKLFDNAVNVDFESWARVMQMTGIKYCTLTVKHGCGFTLWPSKVTNITDLPEYTYTIQANKYFAKRDLVDEFVTAMRKYGIKPGFYYSLGSNLFLGVYGNKASPNGTIPIPGQVLIDIDSYYEVVYQHQVELLTKYGDIVEMWYDGGVPLPIKERLTVAYAKYMPGAVVFQGMGLTPNAVRWPATESGHPTEAMWSTTDDYGDPLLGGWQWYPAECDTTLQNGDNWFYKKSAGARSMEELKSVYHDTVGNNCNLMLNIAPDTRGTVHYQELYGALGDFISICYPSNITLYPAYIQNPTPVGSGKYSLVFKRPTTIDRVVMQEVLSNGECVAAYEIVVERNGKTVAHQTGKWIGHKRIILLQLPVQDATAVHVRVTELQGCAAQLSLIAASDCRLA